MPFVERDLMSEREEFVMFAGREGSNISALCVRFGISRKTGYKWLERHRQAEPDMAWSGCPTLIGYLQTSPERLFTVLFWRGGPADALVSTDRDG